MLTFVLIRQGLGGGSGTQRLTRALGIETENPIMIFEQQSSFFPSAERAPHRTSTENPLRAVVLRLNSVVFYAEPRLPFIGHTPADPQTLPRGATHGWCLVLGAYFLYQFDSSLVLVLTL